MQFRRSPKSATEIAALPALGTTECLAHVRVHGATLDAETLVYLLRGALRIHDSVLFETCGRLLIGSESSDGRWQGGHCEAIIVNLARSFGFLSRARLMRDFRTNCHSQMWIAIHRGSLFWEMLFGMAFRQKCIEAARSMIRREATAKTPPQGGAAVQESPEVDELANPNEPLLDESILARMSSPIYQRMLLAAVRRLPKRQATAVLLAWIEGRRIEGSGDDTVSNLMGITPRGVRQLLAAARKTLSSNPAIRAIWFGEA